MTTNPDDNRLYAYEIFEPTGMPITAGAVARDWMDAMDQRFPYRCLPMTIANQAGWMLHSPMELTAVWDGGPSAASLCIDFGSPPGANAFGGSFVAGTVSHSAVRPELRVSNHFGNGILSF